MSIDKAEVVICTLGTRGDITPFLALACEFLAHGHNVTVLTNENWESLVGETGAEFHAIAPSDPPQDCRNDRSFFLENVYPSFIRSYSFIVAKARKSPSFLIVYRTNMLGAECAAEKLKLLNVKVALQPSVIASIERPPWPLTKLTQNLFAPVSKKMVIPLVYAFAAITSGNFGYVNKFRKSVGLEVIWPWQRPAAEDLLLMLCPEWFAMPQKDWPGRCRTVGFPYSRPNKLDCELESFLNKNELPIVFAPGTGIANISMAVSRAQEICSLLGLPGIFLSGGGANQGLGSDKFIFRSYVQLESLLPRSRLLVHHGGIGCTAQAIKAGIPQIVIPERFDQPDNAIRVAILGLGAAVFSRAEAPVLAGLIRDIQNSSVVKRQISIASSLVSKNRAMETAYQLISCLKKVELK